MTTTDKKTTEDQTETNEGTETGKDGKPLTGIAKKLAEMEAKKRAVAGGGDPDGSGENEENPEKGPEGNAAATEPEPKGDGVVVHDLTSQGASQAVFSPLPDLARLQALSRSAMDPVQQEIYTRALSVELMQVTSSFKQMVKRNDKLLGQVALARKAGYPEHLLQQLALQHGWEIPPPQ